MKLESEELIKLKARAWDRGRQVMLLQQELEQINREIMKLEAELREKDEE